MITLDIQVQRFAAKLLYTRSRTADVMTIARAARASCPGVGKGLKALRKARWLAEHGASKLSDGVAARDDAAPLASRSSRVIFFHVRLLRDRRLEDCFLQVQRVSITRRRMLWASG